MGETGGAAANPPSSLRANRGEGVRLFALLRGQVQGVYFRAFVQRHANALGLTGWVRNLPDGAVEVAAEGPQASLDTLLQHLRRGPPGARVDGVEEGWTAATGMDGPFAIR